MAVERLKTCDNIVALSKELGVHRRLLYKWRDQSAPFDENAEPAIGSSPQGHAPPKSASAQTRAGTRPWRWIFSKVPCKKSRLDASSRAASRPPIRGRADDRA